MVCFAPFSFKLHFKMEVRVLCLRGCFYGCMVIQHSKKSDLDCLKHVVIDPGEGKLHSASCGKTNMSLRRYLYQFVLYKSEDCKYNLYPQWFIYFAVLETSSFL